MKRAAACCGVLLSLGCGGISQSSPSAVVVPLAIPEAISLASSRTWQGGAMRHCVGPDISTQMVQEIADEGEGLTGIRQTSEGPCNVTWVVEFVSANFTADTFLGGTGEAIFSAKVTFATERAVSLANAKHEFGHVLGLLHSDRPGDLMCSPPAGSVGNPCAPFPTDFSPREKEVLRWMYSRK